MAESKHGPVPTTWYTQGMWATCQCGFAPRDNGVLNAHWAEQGFKVYDAGGQLVTEPIAPPAQGKEIRAEAFDLIPGDLVMAGDAASVIGLAIRTLNRAFDEIHKEFTANPGTTEALRLTIVLEAEVQ